MLHIADGQFALSHALGVEPVNSISDLTRIIDQHKADTGERYCPFVIELHGDLRLTRWAARDLTGNGFLVRIEQGREPQCFDADCLLASSVFGRYILEGRMFYDSLNIESFPSLQRMQRLS